MAINNRKECTDHLGNVFESERARARAYNLTIGTINARLDSGWDLEETLTTPNRITESTDHMGNKFKNDRAMYRHWGIPDRVGEGRKCKGWDIKRILTEPIDIENKYLDPISNNMYSIKEFTEKYGITDKNFRYGLEKNKSIISILGISINIWSRWNDINKTKYNLTVVKRIQPGKDVFECYIDNGDGTSMFKIMSYDMIEQHCLEQYKKLHNIV